MTNHNTLISLRKKTSPYRYKMTLSIHDCTVMHWYKSPIIALTQFRAKMGHQMEETRYNYGVVMHIFSRCENERKQRQNVFRLSIYEMLYILCISQ